MCLSFTVFGCPKCLTNSAHLSRLITRSSASCSTDEVFEWDGIATQANKLDRNLLDWPVTQGIRVYSPLTPDPAPVSGTEKPERALEHLLRQKRPIIGCFRGLAPYTSQPSIQRRLQDYGIHADGSSSSLILMDEETLHPRIRCLAVPKNSANWFAARTND